jgi:hypothetical protein
MMLIGRMFESKQTRPSLPRLEDAMAEQQDQMTTPMPIRLSSQLAKPGWIQSEAMGRERLRLLIEQWLKRNSWSLAVVSRLCELALLAEATQPVPDWTAGMPLQSGAWVNHRGHAWEAIGAPVSEPAEGAAGWIDQGLTSRLHASGLNLFLRNRRASLTVSFLLELGRLNEWVAKVKAGKAAPPVEQRLHDLVMAATVIRDGEGILGPEELLSIAGDRLQPPPWPDQPIVSRPSERSVPARQLRAAAAAAGLDIIEDWALIAELYPSKDLSRLERLQQVLCGLAQWDAQQEENEQAACLVLLTQLQQRAAQAAGPQTPEQAVARTISDAAS